MNPRDKDRLKTNLTKVTSVFQGRLAKDKDKKYKKEIKFLTNENKEDSTGH